MAKTVIGAPLLCLESYYWEEEQDGMEDRKWLDLAVPVESAGYAYEIMAGGPHGL